MNKFRMVLFLVSLLALNHSLLSQELVTYSGKEEKGSESDRYLSMTSNGAWCWFSDPRAVYYEGKNKRTYAGWIDNFGDVYIGYYDHETQEIKTTLIYDDLEIDDHDNPSILFDEEGYLLVFFNRHMQGVQPLFLIKSNHPEDIDKLG